MTYGDVAEVDESDDAVAEQDAANDEFDTDTEAELVQLDEALDEDSVADDDLEASFEDDEDLASLDKVLNANTKDSAAEADGTNRGFNVRRALEEKFEMRRMRDDLDDDLDFDHDLDF